MQKQKSMEFLPQSFSGYLLSLSKVDWLLSLRGQQAVTKSKTKKPFVTFKDRHNDLPKSASAFQGIDISQNHWLFSGVQYLGPNSYQMIGTVETLQQKNRRSTTRLFGQNIQWHQFGDMCVFCWALLGWYSSNRIRCAKAGEKQVDSPIPWDTEKVAMRKDKMKCRTFSGQIPLHSVCIGRCFNAMHRFVDAESRSGEWLGSQRWQGPCHHLRIQDKRLETPNHPKISKSCIHHHITSDCTVWGWSICCAGTCAKSCISPKANCQGVANASYLARFW